jgi:hypothetical protein
MKLQISVVRLGVLLAISSMAAGTAGATTVAQNTSWNVVRTGAEDTLRIVAYGDSIKAGYISATTVARRASTHVAAEYGAALWGQNIEIRRRAQSGALAQGIYNRIVSPADRAFMQTPNTIGVDLAMCGNDYLQGRSSFSGQSGTCNYNVLDNALATCQLWTERAVDYINENANSNVKFKILGNLYYPGYAADNQMTSCSDPTTGAPINRRDRFLPLIAESNWRTCDLAVRKGWVCGDNFAEYMAADYDSNGDGVVDIEFIRYQPGESLDDYMARILYAYEAGLLRDSNFKSIAPQDTVGYLLSDNTHMTYLGPTGKANASGNVAVLHPTDDAYPDGRNPTWNLNGHDRMGYSIATNYDLNVDAGPGATIVECEVFESSGDFNDRVFWGPWDVFVDYGNGAGGSTTEAEMSFALNNQYNAPGNYAVEVVVAGAYGTLWEAGTSVQVLSTEEAMAVISEQIDALRADGTLSFGQWNGIRQPFNNAARMLGNGRLNPYRSMMGDFIAGVGALVYSGALSPEVGGELVSYATRTTESASCRERPVGPPPYGRASGRPERVVMPQGRIVDEEWVEIEGVRYELDDSALLDMIGN